MFSIGNSMKVLTPVKLSPLLCGHLPTSQGHRSVSCFAVYCWITVPQYIKNARVLGLDVK